MKLNKPHSLQGRLLFGLVVCMLLALGGTGLYSYVVTQHEADEIFNARLATTARVFDVLIAQKVEKATLANPIVIDLPQELESQTSDESSTLGHRYENKIAFQVWDKSGVLLVRSASAPDRPFGPMTAGYSDSVQSGRHWQVFTLESGHTWVQVAEHDDIREEMADDLSMALITPLLAGLVLLLAVAFLLVRVSLRSLEQLASDISQRGPESLKSIELMARPREVDTVVSAMNRLLDRIRHSREREMRFTDAAAHELKTPLAALRIHANNLSRAASLEEQQQSLQQLLKSLDRTQRLSEQLLALSAVQAEARTEACTRIPVAEWIADVLSDQAPNLDSKRQHFEAVGLDELQPDAIEGQPLKLHRMLSNLIDNASRYGDEGSTVRLRATASPDCLRLELTNTGDTIPPEMLGRILEPYVRVPGSRSEGSGLGLTIVREIVGQHRGELSIDSDAAQRQTRVTVRLPLQAAP